MPLSSQRQRFSIFVSPRNEDFLFYEKVDKQRVLEEIPEYGDPHPDYRKYPNHFFAQAVQADEEGQIYYYYYAAKRDNQDEYNWEHTTVDHKQLTYDQVERTYVTLRSEYDEDSPALGSAMPLTDSDPFDKTDNYALISRGQVRLGEASSRSVKNGETELDSMFVIERRIYLKRVPITTTSYDKQTGAHIFTTTNLVHRDEIISSEFVDVAPLFYLQPDGLSFYLQPDNVSRYAVFGTGTSGVSGLTVAELLTDTDNAFWEVDENTGAHKVVEQVSEEWYYVSDIQNGEANERRVFIYLTPNQNDFVFYELIDRKNEKAEPTDLPEYGDQHPSFTDHKFVAAVPNDNTGDFYKYYYARDRFNEDQYNFSESFVDIGGVRVSLVRRSYVVLRSAYDPTAPVIGASMPSAPDNKFTGNYLLVDRVQRPIEDETLSSLYVSEERVYAKTPDVGSQEGNFTLQEGGLTITRTWIVPRDQVGAFPKPSIGSPDSEYGQYEYATRRVSQETPPEIDSYFSVVLDIYAKKGWAFQEEHQYNIGYKIIETTTLEDDKAGEGNYSVAFDERGWQKQQRSAELTGFDFESKVETRPYGKITTNTSAGTQPIIGQNNTRSEIVYDDGTTQIYQRNVDTFTIKQGSSGQEKNEQIYASITTNKFYRTSGDVLTDTGSSRVIYDDGTVQVYEVGEEVVVAKEGGDAGQTKDEQIFATITTNSRFSTNSTVNTDTGNSRVVYRGGGVTIYQVNEETVVAKEGGDAGQTKAEQIFATITTNSRFSTNSTVNTDTGSSRVVYRGGGVTVYQVDEETVVAKEGGDAGTTIEEQIFATITTNSKFSTSSAVSTTTGRSRVVYRGGGVTIYQVDEETVVAKDGGDAGTTIRKTEAVTITTASSFNTTGAVTGDTGSSRVVYRGGGVVVYQSDNETAVVSNTDAGSSVEKNNFATVTTNSVFNTTGVVTGDTGRSRVTYRGGGITVYQVDNESTVANTSGNAGITKRKTEAVTITTTSNFNTTGAVTGDTGSSRVVYRGGGVVVYQSDNEVAVVSNTAAGTSIEKNNFATVTTNSVFNTTGVVTGDTGRSRVTYRGGGITVYQVDNESTVANTSGNAGITKRKTEAVTITTTSNFNTTGAVTGDTGSSRVVYRGGGVVVYQSDNEVAALSNSDAGTSIEKNNFATVTTTSTFSTASNISGQTGRSRVTYRGGGITVYQVDSESTVANTSGIAGKTIRKTEAVTITTNSNFNTTGDVTGDTGSSRVVYRGGGVVVYQSDNETAVVSNTDAGSSIEKNNFATVTTNSVFNTSGVVTGGTGRSRVTYRGGGITVYQVDNESTVANTSGSAGTTIRKTEAVTITTASNFNTTGAVTGDTGSSRVVYRGGGVVVYQSDNETAVVSNTDAGSSIEKNNFATVTTNSVFNTTGVVTGDTGRSRVTYRGGGITVYQVDNESTVANTTGNAGITKRKTEAVTITTTSNFNTTGAVTGDTGSSRVVYRGGGVVVYQSDNETAVVSNTDAGSSVEKNNFATVTTNSVFNTTGVVTGDTGRSRVTYRGGGITVYQVDNESTVANTSGNAGITKRKTEAVTITTTSNFNTTGAVTGDTGSSRVVYRGGGVVVYQSDNEVAVVSNTAAGTSIEKNNFATVTTNSVFNTTGVVTGDTGRSRVTYRGGGITVYQVDNESTVANLTGTAGTTIRKTEAVTITTTSNFNTTGAVTGDTGSSRVVYRGGGVVVYQSDNEVAALSNSDAGASIEKNNFATVTTTSTFSTSSNISGQTGRSRVTYRGGGITVYQVDSESTVANTSGIAGKTIRKTEAVTITTNSNFNTTGAVTGDTGSSRVVYRGGGVVVYQSDNETAVVSNTAAGTSIEKNNFATVTTNSVFNTTGVVTGDTGRSRVTYRGGGITVYQVDNESTVANTSGNAGITKRKTEAVTITTTSNFNTTGAVTGDTGSSRVVYRGGGVVVYQSDNEVAVVSNTAAGTSIEKNNFATVTTNSVFNTTGVVTGDTGRSRVTYRGGGITVYQVDNESTVANTSGNAGITKRKTEAVTITTTSNFNTTGTVTGDTGSSRVVYRGGGVVVYQSDNETAVVSNTDAGSSVEKNNFATVTTNSVFNTTGVVTGDTGRSRVTYRGGGITVYQVDNESTVANTSGNAGITKRKTEAVTITTTSNFNTTGAVTGDTGSSRVVYRGGGVVVYQSDNESAVLSNTAAGTSVEKNNFATITTNSVFNTTGTVTSDTGRSRVTYRGGGIVVYQVDNETTTPNLTGVAGTTIRQTEAVTITTNSSFNTSGAVTGVTGSSRVVYRGGGVVVYQSDNESAVVSNSNGGTTVEQNQYAKISTAISFSQSGSLSSETGRSRVIYRGGGAIVYQNENETVTPATGSAGTTKEKNNFAIITTTSTFALTGAVSSTTGRSRVVYRGGGKVIYQVDTESIAPNLLADAGTTREQNNFATITTTSSYSTTGTFSGYGRSRVVYRGGDTVVYQTDSEEHVPLLADAGQTKEKRPYATITTSSYFRTTSGVNTGTGRSRVVYRGGGKIIYQVDEEAATINAGADGGKRIEQRIYAKITTAITYSTSTSTATGAGSTARPIYTDGSLVIYQIEKETVDADLTVSTTSKRSTDWGVLETTTKYLATDAPTDANRNYRIRPIYRGGAPLVTVYEEEKDIPKPNTTEEITRQDEDIYRKRIVNTKYTKAPIVAAVNEDVQNTVVYQDLTEKIYRNDRVTYEAKIAVTYETTVNYSWPRVLKSIEIDEYTYKDGSDKNWIPQVRWAKNSYSGPCRASITETWSKEPDAVTTTLTDFLVEDQIQYDTPYYKVNTGPCLHGAYDGSTTFIEIGGANVRYQPVKHTFDFPATKPADWPSSLVISNEQVQRGDGWVKREVTVYPPITAATVPPPAP